MPRRISMPNTGVQSRIKGGKMVNLTRIRGVILRKKELYKQDIIVMGIHNMSI